MNTSLNSSNAVELSPIFPLNRSSLISSNFMKLHPITTIFFLILAPIVPREHYNDVNKSYKKSPDSGFLNDASSSISNENIATSNMFNSSSILNDNIAKSNYNDLYIII
jgi:hypothetical protein